MNDKPVTRLLTQLFILSFVAAIGSVVVLFILMVTGPQGRAITQMESNFMLLLFVAGFAWFITLGIVANRLGRRWFLWIFFSFGTMPIGPLVAFPLMLKNINTARAAQLGAIRSAA